MFSLTPSGTPAETAAAYTLLAIIADPKAAQQRLDEIAAEKQDAIDVIKRAQAQAIDLDTKRAEIDAALATETKIRDENATLFETRSKQLADQEASLADRKDHADSREADLAGRESAVTEREAEVKAREDQVFAREQAEKQLTEAAKSLKSEYEQKVAALRAAVQ